MLKYGVAKKSVTQNKSLVLKGMFRLRYVNCGMSQLHDLFEFSYYDSALYFFFFFFVNSVSNIKVYKLF